MSTRTPGASFARMPLTLATLNQFNPNRANQIEAIWQPFYDLGQTYPLAGGLQFSFFQVALGGGAVPKTYANTNMQLGAQFAAPTAFLVTALMIVFFPQNTVSQIGTAAARAATNWLDAVAVANAGWVEFTIGGKVYLRDAPTGRFAPNFTVNGTAALSGTEVAGNQGDVQFARAAGRYYEITPLLIPQTQNFVVTANFAALVPITVNGLIGCIMDGYFYRQSQ